MNNVALRFISRYASWFSSTGNSRPSQRRPSHPSDRAYAPTLWPSLSTPLAAHVALSAVVMHPPRLGDKLRGVGVQRGKHHHHPKRVGYQPDRARFSLDPARRSMPVLLTLDRCRCWRASLAHPKDATSRRRDGYI